MEQAETGFDVQLRCFWRSTRCVDLVFPPLLLLKPRSEVVTPQAVRPRRQPQQQRHYGQQDQGLLSTGMLLTFTLNLLTMFRFATSTSLMQEGGVGFMPFLWLSMHWTGTSTYLFWYLLFVAVVIASFGSRPHKLSHRILVPEVVVLFMLMLADCAFVVLGANSEEDFEAAIVFSGVEAPWADSFSTGVVDNLFRFWFVVNVVLLLAATITGCISPPSGTITRSVFDVAWALFTSQLVAMWLQRAASSTHVAVQYNLGKSGLLATCRGLSTLYFTHSFTCAMALVLRHHEREHFVPTLGQILRTCNQKHPRSWLIKTTMFCAGAYIWNSWMLSEVLPLTILNLGALWVRMQIGSAGRGQAPACNSWDACVVLAVGGIGSLCWWAKLFGPYSTDSSSSQQSFSACLSAITHFTMTSLFADTFNKRLHPSANQCLFLLFWSFATLCLGMKLHHRSVSIHCQRNKNGYDTWEALTFLGESSLCEFGLLSVAAWVKHIVQSADRWWQVGLAQPAAEVSDMTEPLLSQNRDRSDAGLHIEGWHGRMVDSVYIGSRDVLLTPAASESSLRASPSSIWLGLASGGPPTSARGSGGGDEKLSRAAAETALRRQLSNRQSVE